MSETVILAEIRAAIGSRPTGRTFRNNNGAMKDLTGRWVYYGLGAGSGDLIHIEAVTITPEMVGKTVGMFCSVEVKRPGRDTTHKKRKESQDSWRNMILRFGGRAGIARSVDEAIKIIEGKS